MVEKTFNEFYWTRCFFKMLTIYYYFTNFIIIIKKKLYASDILVRTIAIIYL